jgi:hypothetical protein
VVALIFGLVNAFIKPIIKIVGCLFYIFTLGLISFSWNALLFLRSTGSRACSTCPSTSTAFGGVLGCDRHGHRELGDQPGYPGSSRGKGVGDTRLRSTAWSPVERRNEGALPMPIASPEVYAEMLDRAKAGAFAYPAINVTSSQTLNAALQGFAEAESDGIIQVSTGGAEYLSGPTSRTWSPAPCARRVRDRGGQELPGQHRAAHRPLPEEQARRVRRPAARDLARSGSRRPAPLFQSHMWDGSAVPSTRTCRSPRSCCAGRRPRTSSSRSRSAWSVARRTASPAAIDDKLYSTGRGRPGHRRRARPGREGPLHDGPDLRQRARRLQAGQRQAAPGDPQGDPGGGRRQVRQGEAARPGLPRRSGSLLSEIRARSTTAWSR